MAKGDGSIFQCKDKDGNLIRNRWRVEIAFGTNPITGKRERVIRHITGTKADARALRDEIRRQHEIGVPADSSNMLFGEFASEWYETREASGELSRHTLYNDRQHVKVLSAHIANVKLAEITPQMVESLYLKIRKEKSARLGHQVSSTTMHRIHATFKQIMQKAVDYDLTLRNPVARVKAPKISNPDRRSLSLEEATALSTYLEYSEKNAFMEFEAKEERQVEWGVEANRSSIKGVSKLSYHLAVRLGLVTGMRRGEVFGLTWGNLDCEKQLLHVEQSRTMYGEIKEPKTQAGNRDIALDATTVRHLQRYMAAQVDVLHALRLLSDKEYKPHDDMPLLCSNTGTWCDLRNFETWWKAWREEAGFPDLRFHELRHTQATQLLANGVDLKTVQTRMGHANAAITLNWYAHPDPKNDRMAADLLEGLFCPLPPHCHFGDMTR